MNTGFRGLYVISWAQTEIDGVPNAPALALHIGAGWQWRGEALRVDGPTSVLLLDEAIGERALRKRAAHKISRQFGIKLVDGCAKEGEADRSGPGFTVTDGRQSYEVQVIESDDQSRNFLLFEDKLPPRDRQLWIARSSWKPQLINRGRQNTGLICFTPGTLILTERGLQRVEYLRPGDKVQTKDSGLQELLWLGSRRLSATRLALNPALRPVRIKREAFGPSGPFQDLLVSPEHHILRSGSAAQALFNEPELLVSADSLVDGRLVRREPLRDQVTYFHLLLPRHEVIWANGMETESFFPDAADLEALDHSQKQSLVACMPSMEIAAGFYGASARRRLIGSETAILRHAAA